MINNGRKDVELFSSLEILLMLQ